VSEAPDTGLVTNCPRQRLPESNADVLDRVMRIDFKIALGLNGQVNEAVATDLVEHVIKKGDAAGEPTLAGTIQIEGDAYLRLFGVASDFGGSHVGRSSGLVGQRLFQGLEKRGVLLG
jgi:hypothetical protein